MGHTLRSLLFLVLPLLALNVACQKMTFEQLPINEKAELPPVIEEPPVEEPPIEEPPVDTYRSVKEDFRVTSTQVPADVLFVVDNSQRMFGPLRDSVPNRFARFIEGLQGQDYRVAVTTGDASGIREYQGGNITRILRSPTPASGTPASPLRYYLDGSTANEGRLLQMTLMRPEAICTQVGTHLCPPGSNGRQEPLKSTQLAFDKNSRGFLRANSSIHVVIIAGGDEAAGSTNSEIRNRAQVLKNKWGTGREFKIHSLIRRPNERCNTQYNFSEAGLLDQAARLTGGDVLDLCDELESSSIRALAAKIRPRKVLSKVTTLTCDPLDIDKDGQIDLVVTLKSTGRRLDHHLQGRRVEILSAVQDLDDVQLNYYCR